MFTSADVTLRSGDVTFRSADVKFRSANVTFRSADGSGGSRMTALSRPLLID
jgi:hypothetical protein